MVRIPVGASLVPEVSVIDAQLRALLGLSSLLVHSILLTELQSDGGLILVFILHANSVICGVIGVDASYSSYTVAHKGSFRFQMITLLL